MPEKQTHQDKYFPATGMPDPDWWQGLWPDPLNTLKILGFRRGMVVVDLCCGDGLFTAPLSSLLEGQVIAIDLDPAMIKLAELNVKTVGAPECRWVVGDARDLPQLITDPVDSVLIANTFHGVPEQAELSRSVSDILKPGGTFLIINWHHLSREETTVFGQPRGPRTGMRMSPDDLKRVVEPSGLWLERIVELPPYHYGAVFKKP